MNLKLDRYLVGRYPLLYRDRYGDMRNTCMVWGFDVGDGWFKTIDRLSARLEALIQVMPPVCSCGHAPHWHEVSKGACVMPLESHPDNPESVAWEPCGCPSYHDGRPAAVQVKEKFGGLRFYMSSETDEIESAIREAEEECDRTCERCGRPGEATNDGWCRTECGRCAFRRRLSRRVDYFIYRVKPLRWLRSRWWRVKRSVKRWLGRSRDTR